MASSINKKHASFLVLLLLLTPWLSPYAGGPSHHVVPWLVSAYCAVFIFCLRGNLSIHVIAKAWLIAAVVSASIGLIQYFGLSSNFDWVMAKTRAGEALGNLRQRNQLATLTSIGLIAWLGMMAYKDRLVAVQRTASEKKRREQNSIAKPMDYFILTLLALGNASTGSRTGLIQWIFVLVISLIWCWRGKDRLVAWRAIFAFVLYVVSMLSLPWVLQQWMGVNSVGVLSRAVQTIGGDSRGILWSNMLTLIAQKPWFGWGWGELDYAHFMTLYSEGRFPGLLDNAHNLPLHVAVELGLPAAVLLSAFVGWIVLYNRPWNETSFVRQMAWSVLAVIGLHSMLEYPLWYGPFQIACVLSIAILWRTRQLREDAFGKHAPSNEAGQDSSDWNRTFKYPESGVSTVPVASHKKNWFANLAALVTLGLLLSASMDYFKVSQLYRLPSARADRYREDTLQKVSDVFWFRNQLVFAIVKTAQINDKTAAATFDLAMEMLHFSPEPRMIVKLINTALILGRKNEADYYIERFKHSYPTEYAVWLKRQGRVEPTVSDPQ